MPDWDGLVPESLNEITLRRFIEYNNTVVTQMPPSMKELTEIEDEIVEVKADKKKSLKLRETKEKELREKYNDKLKAIPELIIKTQWVDHYEREIQFWSDMPADYKGMIALESLMELRTLINNLMATYIPSRELKSFVFQGETWYLPPPEMNGSTAIEFIESAQYEHNYNRMMEDSKMEVDEIGLKVTSRWNSLLPIVCILCRKEDERNIVLWYQRNNQQSPSEFFDGIIQERKQKFAELPMSVALDVFFSFSVSRLSYLSSMVQRSVSSRAKT